MLSTIKLTSRSKTFFNLYGLITFLSKENILHAAKILIFKQPFQMIAESICIKNTEYPTTTSLPPSQEEPFIYC